MIQSRQMNKANLIEVALFPLPSLLVFPHRVIPLHIFEPRYKKLIEDCLALKREMAVVYAKKSPSPILNFDPSNPAQSLLNNATGPQKYQPHNIFAAGKVDIVQQTSDGRYYINVNLNKRYKIEKELQTSPYIIGQCSELKDEQEISCIELSKEYLEAKALIDETLDKNSANDPDKKSFFLTKIKNEQSLNAYTFLVLSLIGADDGILIKALDSRDPMERFNLIQKIISPKHKMGTPQ